jgi:hypothetical protein
VQKTIMVSHRINGLRMPPHQWSEPVWVGPTINSDGFIDFASLASDGTLYFMRWDATQKSMHLWRSQYKHGFYRAPEFVTLGGPTESIHDPAVAPDQSFIVFDLGKVKGDLGRLCISFLEGDHWVSRSTWGTPLTPTDTQSISRASPVSKAFHLHPGCARIVSRTARIE